MLDKAEYSAFQSTLNSPIVSYRKVIQIYSDRNLVSVTDGIGQTPCSFEHYLVCNQTYTQTRNTFYGTRYLSHCCALFCSSGSMFLSLTFKNFLVNEGTNFTTALYCHHFGSRDRAYFRLISHKQCEIQGWC